MKIRLRSFIPAVLALVLITVFAAAVVCRPALAQSAPGPKDFKKAAEQIPAGKDVVLVTFVEIGSVNCIPCKAMQPIMQAVEEEYRGQVKIVFHDVWTAKGKMDAAKYNIRVIPTQVFLDKNGHEYYRHEGYFPKEGVVQVIKMQGVK